jgi:hypothetical protein
MDGEPSLPFVDGTNPDATFALDGPDGGQYSDAPRDGSAFNEFPKSAIFMSSNLVLHGGLLELGPIRLATSLV